MGNSRPVHVSYDQRAITINGERILMTSGAIHYPRSTPMMWPDLLRRSREAGLNVIETYVFWNLHEQERGQFDFSGRLDLLRFCQLAQEQGLYVILRIGPYICAEINYGGLPAWLRDVPGMQMRTDNEPFKFEVERWVRALCEYMHPCFAPQGGPIILAQMENEYSLVAANYGTEGQRYLQRMADFGQSLNLGIPQIMCYGAAEGVIETMNSFTAHEVINDYKTRHPEQPALWTENWPGWYDVYGNPHHTRTPEHVAYAVARFVAAGGSGVNYYMWHGGTNFGRESMFLQTTSYDYDAPLDEYGFPTTKYYHLAALHEVLHHNQAVLLTQEAPHGERLGEQQLAFRYQDGDDALTFLCNDSLEASSVTLRDKKIVLPAQSVLIVSGDQILFNSSVIAACHIVNKTITPLDVFSPFSSWREPYGKSADENRPIVEHVEPLEQLQLTHDRSDYCWYTTELDVAMNETPTATLTIRGLADIAYIFVDGERVGISEQYLHERRGPVDGATFTQTFPLSLTPGKHQLAILCCAVGLIKGDWMIGNQNMVNERKGIWGEVRWNERILSGAWTMLPALLGEHQQRFVPASANKLEWQHDTTGERPLTWWHTSFASPVFEDEQTALALDMQGMNKGLLWLNGHCLGRYWQLPVHERDEEGKPTGRQSSPDEITQRYYHVPREWLQQENTLTVFEEMGGTPAQIRLCLCRPQKQ